MYATPLGPPAGVACILFFRIDRIAPVDKMIRHPSHTTDSAPKTNPTSSIRFSAAAALQAGAGAGGRRRLSRPDAGGRGWLQAQASGGGRRHRQAVAAGGSPLLVVPAGAGPLRLFPDGAPGHQPPLAVLLAADSAMATKGKLGEAPTAALLRCRASPGLPLAHRALARHPATLLTTPIRTGSRSRRRLVPCQARAAVRHGDRGWSSATVLLHRVVAWMRRRAPLDHPAATTSPMVAGHPRPCPWLH